MSNKDSGEQYSVKETQRRVKAALQGAFNTPPKPLKSIKAAKQKRTAAKGKTPGK
jgi:hypothetical protein